VAVKLIVRDGAPKDVHAGVGVKTGDNECGAVGKGNERRGEG
jgi:hypothetical protein